MTKIKALRVSCLSDNFSGVGVDEFILDDPKTDQVQIAIRSASINFPDVLMCSGGYQLKPPLPFTLGLEGAGVITKLGANVSGWKIGAEVICGGGGLLATSANVNSSNLSLKSADMNWNEAASFRVAWLTAYVALFVRGNVRAGESLLVLGAGSGVGLAAVDVGVKLGAKVFAVASSEEKRVLAKKYGAHLVFGIEKNLVENIKIANNGKGVEIAYDPVGGEMFDVARRCLGWQGRLLVIGFASGKPPVLPVNYALIKGLSIIGVRAGEFSRQNIAGGKKANAVLDDWAKQGLIRPHIGAQFNLAAGVEALKMMAKRKAIGKTCVIMDK